MRRNVTSNPSLHQSISIPRHRQILVSCLGRTFKLINIVSHRPSPGTLDLYKYILYAKPKLLSGFPRIHRLHYSLSSRFQSAPVYSIVAVWLPQPLPSLRQTKLHHPQEACRLSNIPDHHQVHQRRQRNSGTSTNGKPWRQRGAERGIQNRHSLRL